MDLENFAHVGMTDFPCVAHLGRQPFPETRLGALEGDAPLQFLVDGFVDDTHAPLRHLAHYPEAAIDEISRLERMLVCRWRKERVQHEPFHPLFPFDVVPYLAEQFGVVGTCAVEISLALVRGSSQGQLDQSHHQVIVLRLLGHFRSPAVKTTTVEHRTTFAASCECSYPARLLLLHR